MNPIWRQRWFAAGGSLVALWLGWQIAEGNYQLPLLASALAVSALVAHWQRMPLDAVVLGALLVGYIVGNRGFAQLSLTPGLPLFPAEVGLAIALIAIVLRLAFLKTLPVRRDFLNGAVLLWIALGSARIGLDVRSHGFAALRDFAMIYYAGFFFAAQGVARTRAIRSWLGRCLLGACVVLPVIVFLFRWFPDFFLGRLVWSGVPLIFLKGDLAGTFMAVGVVLAHQRFERTRRSAWLVAAALCAIGVLLSENRAALLGLGVATAWLVLAQHWSLLRWQLAGAGTAILVFIVVTISGAMEWRQTPVFETYERLASLTDLHGEREYLSSNVEFKGDNNQFRLVWWQSVILTTWDGNPWLGQGFGFDLASDFVRQYYADGGEEFNTRSPHSVVLTVFGRMGFAGLAAFLLIIAGLVRPTWRALRSARPPNETTAMWLGAWIVLVSSCFGVVLEGPMGAMVFWMILGLANAATWHEIEENSRGNVADLAPDLPVAGETVSAGRA